MLFTKQQPFGVSCWSISYHLKAFSPATFQAENDAEIQAEMDAKILAENNAEIQAKKKAEIVSI